MCNWRWSPAFPFLGSVLLPLATDVSGERIFHLQPPSSGDLLDVRLIHQSAVAPWLKTNLVRYKAFAGLFQTESRVLDELIKTSLDSHLGSTIRTSFLDKFWCQLWLTPKTFSFFFSTTAAYCCSISQAAKVIYNQTTHSVIFLIHHHRECDIVLDKSTERV